MCVHFNLFVILLHTFFITHPVTLSSPNQNTVFITTQTPHTLTNHKWNCKLKSHVQCRHKHCVINYELIFYGGVLILSLGEFMYSVCGKTTLLCCELWVIGNYLLVSGRISVFWLQSSYQQEFQHKNGKITTIQTQKIESNQILNWNS